MFGDGNPFFGTEGLWFVGGVDNSPAMGDAYKGVYSSINWTGIPLWTKFFFQLVFAGTAATIVSGAVAERIKFGAFYIFTFLMVGIIYPDYRSLDLGWGLGGQAWHVRLCRLDGGSLGGRLGGIGGNHRFGSSHRKVQQRRKSHCHTGSQFGLGHAGGLRAVVWLVRV